MKYNTFGIGFDQFFADVERAFKEPVVTYPPHNIVRLDNNEFIVELAVAGFSKDELTIELKEKSLLVSGQKNEKDEREYTHKGIGTRSFDRTFKLAEHVIVTDATITNGILGISLKLEIPEEKKPLKINIK